MATAIYETEASGTTAETAGDISVARWWYGPDVPPDPEFDPGGNARDQIPRWAARHGLTLYQGWPGNKHPRKHHPQPGSCPEAGPEGLCRCFVMWGGTGPALIRVRQHMAVLDEDSSAAGELTAPMGLPPHFAIRSRSSGGVKRFGFISGGVRRAIRVVDDKYDLDLIGNPDGRCVWLKLWDDTGYDLISQTDAVPEWPAAVAGLAGGGGHGGVITGPAGGARRAEADGADDLPATAMLVAEGIPYGRQDDWLKSIAAREARTQHLLRHEFDEDKITATLAAIIRASEQATSSVADGPAAGQGRIGHQVRHRRGG